MPDAPPFPDDCLHLLDDLQREPPRDVGTPAPVLIVPHLIAPVLCRHLIDVFEASPDEPGEVARIDAEGRICSVVDASKKQRRDVMLSPQTQLHRVLRDRLLVRCRQEIMHAFQANVCYTDRILLARYDAAAGWFRRHRDNTAEHVAFRQFALTVNLNTGDYEGGHLWFPEYNDHRYAPPIGGGLIFSASLLHEATPVISGRRYVLLTFFHGEAAEAGRLSYLAGKGVAGAQ